MMLKIFVTGDNHFGRKFDKYSVKNQLIESRFECLEEMVKMAEKEHCEFFVITGDLFDNTYAISKNDVNRVVEILAGFNQKVLVLPGNHDFYSGNEKLWKDFTTVSDTYGNIVVLNKYTHFEFDSTDGKVIVYPAYCDSKHSDTNRLSWIYNEDINPIDRYNIGIAHGALEGLAIDTEGIYFPMNRAELHSIPVDVWLLGHAHVTEPNIIEGEEVSGYNIFNAGTHEQLDLHNNTEGNAFIVTIQNNNGIKKILAKKIITGKIRYFDLNFKANDSRGLEEALSNLVKNYQEKSIIRLTISGSIEAAEYKEKERIYENILGKFIYYSINDTALSEKINKDKIESEFSEIGFVAKFLDGLLDNPVELQMAYDVVKTLKQ